MSKKCLPGVTCVENVTLFTLFVISILFTYVFFIYYIKDSKNKNTTQNSNPIIIHTPSSLGLNNTRSDTINDPYVPPLKNTNPLMQNSNVNAIPVNIQTRGTHSNYEQVGILTRQNSNDDLILPLMGRITMSGRDKWQYYTISNTGNLNTKLPVSVNGKSCTSEYGCDNIYNGDTVFVEGYNDSFIATIYENNPFRYIPNI
jgi:hypothetical protein|tara:strand:- start:345 stop:947 length:603 start_codon:yes stop_codon:yes gene_type:complete